MNLVKTYLLHADKAFNRLLNSLAVLGGAIVLMIAVLVTIAVLSRYYFGKPMAWSIEIIEYSLLYLTFMGGAWLLRENGHVRIDILIRRLPEKLQRAVNIIPDIIGIIISLCLVWSGAKITLESYHAGTVLYKFLGVPRYLIFWVIPFGSLLLLIQFIKLFFKHMARLKMTDDNTDSGTDSS